MSKTKQSAQPEKTFLDAMGMSARLVNDKEKQEILSHLGSESRGFFRRAFRITNSKTEKAFAAYCQANALTGKNIHHYYHGSKNANYLGILSEGLSLNPKAPITGKMFGYGLYFATRAKKSINYTDINGSYWAKGHSDRAYLAVFKVAYKNEKNVYEWHSNLGTLSKHNIAPHDALFAHKGKMLVNDEVIIYTEPQATIEYLIELGCDH